MPSIKAYVLLQVMSASPHKLTQHSFMSNEGARPTQNTHEGGTDDTSRKSRVVTTKPFHQLAATLVLALHVPKVT